MIFKPKKLLEGSLVVASLTTVGCGDDATPRERVEAAIADICDKVAECYMYDDTYVNACIAEYRSYLPDDLDALPEGCIDAQVSYVDCLTSQSCTTLMDDEADPCAAQYARLDSACPDM